MQTQKARNGSQDVLKKVSPRAVRSLKISAIEPDSSSSSVSASYKTPKDKSPKLIDRKSPRSPVSEKKRPSRITELESLVSQLQEDLKKAKDQILVSETSKKQAEQEAEESKKQLQEGSSKLEETQNQFFEEEETDKKTGLSVFVHEIRQLKLEIEKVASSEANHVKEAELRNSEIHLLRGNLMDTLFLVENFSNKLQDSEVITEAETEALATETLKQLENAKKAVEELKSDGTKQVESYKKMAMELEQTKSRIVWLEALVSKLQTNPEELKDYESLKLSVSNETEEEVSSLRSEVKRLREALEASNEEAYSRLRIQSELKIAKSEIDELKASLIDKETKLEIVSEEKDILDLKLKEAMIDKETELQIISEENETLKSDIKRKERDVEEAIVKLRIAMEEAEESSKRAVRVAEELDAAQASNSEMETELRKVKVQSNQWRKAAEAATAMLSAGENGSFGENCDKMDSPYCEGVEEDDELMKKKNGNVLKKIGVLWKKPQK